jgi:hypothetical protein
MMCVVLGSATRGAPLCCVPCVACRGQVLPLLLLLLLLHPPGLSCEWWRLQAGLVLV